MNEVFKRLLEEIPEYEHFLTAEELDASSRALAEAFPETVSLRTIGKTIAGRDLLCL